MELYIQLESQLNLAILEQVYKYTNLITPIILAQQREAQTQRPSDKSQVISSFQHQQP